MPEITGETRERQVDQRDQQRSCPGTRTCAIAHAAATPNTTFERHGDRGREQREPQRRSAIGLAKAATYARPALLRAPARRRRRAARTRNRPRKQRAPMSVSSELARRRARRVRAGVVVRRLRHADRRAAPATAARLMREQQHERRQQHDAAIAVAPA